MAYNLEWFKERAKKAKVATPEVPAVSTEKNNRVWLLQFSR